MTQTKNDYANTPENNANDTVLSFTLRRLHANLRSPRYWLITGAVVFLAAMAGPYFTLERLSFPERLVYWGTTVICSSILMTFLSIFSYRLTEARGWNWIIVAVVASLAGLAPVVGSLYLAEGLATGFPADWSQAVPFWSLTASVAPALIAVTVMVNLFIRLQHPEPPMPPPINRPQPPEVGLTLTTLQRKLPQHLGHDIISVRAQDHYVEVTTPKGSAMVLMRLGDAVEDLVPLSGLQVHRSWWINLSHVARTEQGSNGPEVLMTSDQRIPVGRSFRAAFKNAMNDQAQ